MLASQLKSEMRNRPETLCSYIDLRMSVPLPVPRVFCPESVAVGCALFGSRGLHPSFGPRTFRRAGLPGCELLHPFLIFLGRSGIQLPSLCIAIGHFVAEAQGLGVVEYDAYRLP